MRYESGVISSSLPEIVFKGGERAKPALKFNKRPPHGGREMEEDDPTPPEDKESSHHHKDDKSKVENNKEISK